MRRKTTQIIWGLVFLAAAVLLFCRALNIINFSLFTGWWTLFIIVPSLVSLFTEKQKIGSLAGLITGIMLYLGTTGLVKTIVLVQMILPLVLLLTGLAILFGKFTRQTPDCKDDNHDDQGSDCEHENGEHESRLDKNIVAIFGSQRAAYCGRKFSGSRCVAIFGGIDIDLRGSEIKDGSTIECVSVFGNAKIIVPENVKVSVTSVPVFGSLENKIRDNSGEKLIHVNAVCIFGNVSVL